MLRVKLYWKSGEITESVFKNYRELNKYQDEKRDLEKFEVKESFKAWRGKHEL